MDFINNDNSTKENQTTRFFKILFKEGGTNRKEDYEYVGGSEDGVHKHLQYYREMRSKYPWLTQPTYTKKCICGVSIVVNCYVSNMETKITTCS